jgi:hypothetical protein
MGRYLDIARRVRMTAAEKTEPVVTDEVTPIIALDEINKIVDGLNAKFLSVKPRGWLPEQLESRRRK